MTTILTTKIALTITTIINKKLKFKRLQDFTIFVYLKCVKIKKRQKEIKIQTTHSKSEQMKKGKMT